MNTPVTMGLPQGNVTFVFTDIEGSTQLCRQLGPKYVDLLHGHRAELQAAWDAYGGHKIGCEGDSILVAFSSARDAVAACVEGQRRLAQTEWPGATDLRVRMGLHNGWAKPCGHEYISLTVHQTARIVSIADGGQILASPSVIACLSAAQLAKTVALGRCAVRDFRQPIELYCFFDDTVDLMVGLPQRANTATSERWHSLRNRVWPTSRRSDARTMDSPDYLMMHR